ncbi:predicted protein [Brucella ceti B1/94]|nr:predicted protein [Brucella ceti B1/94]EEZ09288.1 predicted protein [Brucella ceti M490/95/1]
MSTHFARYPQGFTRQIEPETKKALNFDRDSRKKQSRHSIGGFVPRHARIFYRL